MTFIHTITFVHACLLRQLLRQTITKTEDFNVNHKLMQTDEVHYRQFENIFHVQHQQFTEAFY